MNPFIRNFAASRHFLLLLLLAGCGTPAERQVRQTLRCAEEVLAEHPDSALMLLTPLDTMSLAGEEQAWYAVLRTQADYKLYHPLTTDSLPLLATAYYGTPRRPHYRAAMAWYSLGCVYTEHNDDPRAIDAYLKACDLFPDTLCRYYALTEQNLGIRYLNSCDYLNAIRMLQCFRANAVALSDSDLVGYADYFLGKSYMQYAEYEDAVGYYMNVLENSGFTSKYKTETLFQLAKIKHQQGLEEDAMAYDEQYLDKAMKSPPPCAAFYLKGDIFYNIGIYDSAHFYYRKALDGCYDLGTLCCTYEKLTKLTSIYDTDSLESYSDKHTLYRDSIYNSDRTAEIGQIRARHQIDFKLQQAEYEKNRLVILLSAAVLFILVVAFLSFRYYRVRHEADYLHRIKALQDQIRSLSSSLSGTYGEQEHPAADGHSLHSDADLETLRQMVHSSIQLFVQSHKQEHQTLLLHESPLTQRDAFSELLTLSFTEVIAYLKATYPSVTKDEVLMAICALLGYDTPCVAELQAVSDSAIRSRKNRLKNKVPPAVFAIFFPEQP